MTNEKTIMCLEDMKIKVPIPKAAKQARENNEALDVAIKALQSEPKMGRWIYKNDLITVPGGYWECSECKEGRLLYEANFCPNCGADMRTAEQIVHDAIDNTPMAEDAYPGIKERLHKAVDDMSEVTNGN